MGKNIVIDFYGKNIADYRKIKEIKEDLSNLPGCIGVNHYMKENVTLAGYSSLIIEWAIENKEFLIALTALIYSLLKKDSKNKIIINNIVFTNSDDLDSIENKIIRI